MNPTPEILHLARQLRDQAEPLIDQPDSLVYRLAAAYLLHAPYETTRRLNREIIGSLRDDLVLEYLIYSLERGENPHPNTMVEGQSQAEQSSAFQKSESAQGVPGQRSSNTPTTGQLSLKVTGATAMQVDPEIIDLARRIREQGDEYPTLPDSLIYRLAAATLLESPGAEIRGIQDAYLELLDPGYLVRRAMVAVKGKPGVAYPHPNAEAALKLLTEAADLLAWERE